MVAAQVPIFAHHSCHHRLGCPKKSWNKRVSTVQHSTDDRLQRFATYHVKSKQGVEFDESMEVTKYYGDGQEYHVSWVSAEETHKLDNLGQGEHEDELGPKGVSSAFHFPPSRGPPTGGKEERVHQKRQRGKSGNVESIRAPPLLSRNSGQERPG